MKTISLDQLTGVWVSNDGLFSMWVSNDGKCIVVKKDIEIIVSETTNFSWNEDMNECRLSNSVLLKQLFEDGDICIDVSLQGQRYRMFLKHTS